MDFFFFFSITCAHRALVDNAASSNKCQQDSAARYSYVHLYNPLTFNRYATAPPAPYRHSDVPRRMRVDIWETTWTP